MVEPGLNPDARVNNGLSGNSDGAAYMAGRILWGRRVMNERRRDRFFVDYIAGQLAAHAHKLKWEAELPVNRRNRDVLLKLSQTLDACANDCSRHLRDWIGR